MDGERSLVGGRPSSVLDCFSADPDEGPALSAVRLGGRGATATGGGGCTESEGYNEPVGKPCSRSCSIVLRFKPRTLVDLWATITNVLFLDSEKTHFLDESAAIHHPRQLGPRMTICSPSHRAAQSLRYPTAVANTNFPKPVLSRLLGETATNNEVHSNPPGNRGE